MNKVLIEKLKKIEQTKNECVKKDINTSDSFIKETKEFKTKYDAFLASNKKPIPPLKPNEVKKPQNNLFVDSDWPYEYRREPSGEIKNYSLMSYDAYKEKLERFHLPKWNDIIIPLHILVKLLFLISIVLLVLPFALGWPELWRIICLIASGILAVSSIVIDCTKISAYYSEWCGTFSFVVSRLLSRRRLKRNYLDQYFKNYYVWWYGYEYSDNNCVVKSNAKASSYLTNPTEDKNKEPHIVLKEFADFVKKENEYYGYCKKQSQWEADNKKYQQQLANYNKLEKEFVDKLIANIRNDMLESANKTHASSALAYEKALKEADYPKSQLDKLNYIIDILECGKAETLSEAFKYYDSSVLEQQKAEIELKRIQLEKERERKETERFEAERLKYERNLYGPHKYLVHNNQSIVSTDARSITVSAYSEAEAISAAAAMHPEWGVYVAERYDDD